MRKTYVITGTMIMVIILVVIFGGIGVTKGMGIWLTESNKTPVRFESGNFEGAYNPDDIRGSYSFGEISDLFEIPIEVLYDAFDLPEPLRSSDFKSKDLEGLFGEDVIGNDSLKAFVALYKGLPYTLDEVRLPEAAVVLLMPIYADDAEMQSTLHAIAVTEDALANLKLESEVAPSASETTLNEDISSTEPIINGNTTFMQAIELGLTTEQIESVIGGDMPSTAMTLKDYCVSNGLSFSAVKGELTSLITNP